MAGERETELKLRLESREDYEKLAAADDLGLALPTLTFANHYFDTAARELVARGVLLRLRAFADGRVVLAFKHGGEVASRPGFFDALEVEAAVPGTLLEEAIRRPAALLEHDAAAPVEALVERCGRPALVYLGSLRTVRRRRRLGDYLLELDELTFPDGAKAYEVEVETGDPELARALLERELALRGVRARAQRFTKLEELLARERHPS